MPDEPIELDDLTVEELDGLMKNPDALGELMHPDIPAEPPAEPPAPPATPERGPEPPPAPEQPPSPPGEPAEPDVSDAEILKARVEAAEAASKRWETIAGRHAGELGHIRQKMKEWEGRFAAPPIAPATEDQGLDEEPEPPPRRTAPVAAPRSPENDAIRDWACRQALAQATAEFGAKHEDFGDMQKDISEYIEKMGPDVPDLLAGGDPNRTHRAVSSLLEEARDAVVSARRSAKVRELEQRRADQTTKLAEAKQKAASSAPGSTPPEPAPQKGLDDMTAAELDAMLIKMAGKR